MSRRRSLCGWRMQAADDSGDGNRETSEPAEGEAWVIRASPREQAETAEAETSGEGAAAKAASTGDEVHVCTVCGYLYETRTGEPFLRIRPGTRFEELDPATFRCPSCKSGKERFQPTTRVMSGPRGSERYGLGANELTPAQKNTLIFGALFLGFLLLMSGYLFN
ncbi:hypothetical protein CDCA_CDCA14G3806 [Cyanidium caldarium]|uniref:Rubredoxin-like domain-containing protein n=1 Tax=Cyanidium caldarium TaxID=2771 RepID=A0AAV9J065_CYACA|nr:hypothetical protein CDCA_CDCA14G3806 [Cyanidium caldarium]